jgi:UPF0176 protein
MSRSEPAATLNIAAYRFVTLDDLPALQAQWRAEASALGLKGTVLLAPEGVNLFLAGAPDAVETFILQREADGRFRGMAYKRSVSAAQPFRKLLVKLKREIITLRQPQVQPAQLPAPEVSPRVLKQWLDQGHDDAGRPVVMLDTRNAFEVAQGCFESAVHTNIGKFSDFPAALPPPEAFAGKTVVTYCTGGIRCEKAAPWMLQAGYADVVQLKGGILQYFEDCGGAHYAGECFVFDERVALDGALRPAKFG